MTDEPTDTEQPSGLVLSRPRWAFLAVGLAGFVAAVVCMVMSLRASWEPYLPYWGAAMQSVPANDTAAGWMTAGVVTGCVGLGTALTATAPKPLVAAAATVGFFGVGAALFFLVLTLGGVSV